ncbi:MAG: PadR family transcriptional regulator [Actinopolymorphaceae bacterium]
MSIGLALMGVLADGPAHGYDLKHAYDRRFPGAKPLAYGQVYASLARMERDGFVEVAETSQAGGPERTTYALTHAGRARVRDWLREPEPAGPYAADDLVRKTVTALCLGADAAAFLAQQRALHMARMRELVSLQRAQQEPEARIAVDHTVFHLDADLQWLDAAAARVAAEGAVPK